MTMYPYVMTQENVNAEMKMQDFLKLRQSGQLRHLIQT